MSFQWTTVAVFLYAEVGFMILMMLPWIRPPVWSKIFNSRIVRSIQKYAYIYKYALGGILIVLFFDAVREVQKYSEADKLQDVQQHTAPGDALIHMRLFRAQRNLYISGFTIFLALVIRRTVELVLKEANLMASTEASMRQAQSASAAAKQFMDQDPKKKKEAQEVEATKMKGLILELKQKIKDAEDERDELQEQAGQVKGEYENLMDEYNRLQKVLKRSGDIADKDK